MSDRRLSRVDLYLGLALFGIAAAVWLIAAAAGAAAHERRRRAPTKALVDALTIDCRNLRESVEHLRGALGSSRDLIVELEQHDAEVGLQFDILSNLPDPPP